MVHQLIERDSVKIGNHVHGPSINKRERERKRFFVLIGKGQRQCPVRF